MSDISGTGLGDTSNPSSDPATPAEPAEVNQGDGSQEQYVLDIGSFGSHLITVKVDGQEIEVPLNEVASGYMRQADFTRKTQDLAKQRKQLEGMALLADTLANDPHTAIQTLADFTGVDLSELVGVPNQGRSADNDAWDSYDYEFSYNDDESEIDVSELQALKSEIASLKQALGAVQQTSAQKQVQEQIDALRSQYAASDEDVQATLQFAMKNNLQDIEAAYLKSNAASLREALVAKRTADSEAASLAQQKQAAKVITLNAGVASALPPVEKAVPDDWRQVLEMEMAALDTAS